MILVVFAISRNAKVFECVHMPLDTIIYASLFFCLFVLLGFFRFVFVNASFVFFLSFFF